MTAPLSRSSNEEILRLSRMSDSLGEYRKSDGTVRHKCFLSYHEEDADEVLAFVKKYEDVFIPRAVGISDEYPWVNSNDDDYVMSVIRSDFLGDSTVTLVLIGRCTWSRKFVDWEVYSSLRLSKYSRLNGLLAIQLPSTESGANPKLPERVDANIIRNEKGTDTGYARYIRYPDRASRLRSCIEDAFQARTSRSEIRVLGGPRRPGNRQCS